MKGSTTAFHGKGKYNKDPRFKLIKTIKLSCPDYYLHSKELSRLYQQFFRAFDDDINDENFNKVSNKLKAGRDYKVKIFQNKQLVRSNDCLEFLKNQKVILVGAQGLALLWQLKRNIFPAGKCTVSFDIKSSLFKDDDDSSRVPFITRDIDDNYEFNLGYFQGDWLPDFCFICFNCF